MCLLDSCFVINSSWDCVNKSCVEPGTGNGQYSTLASCLLDSCSVTTNVVNYTTDIFLYPNPSNSMVVLKGVPNNSPYNITSVDGSYFKSSILNGNKIDISSLKKGVYFLECNYKKTKLIKN